MCCHRLEQLEVGGGDRGSDGCRGEEGREVAQGRVGQVRERGGGGACTEPGGRGEGSQERREVGGHVSRGEEDVEHRQAFFQAEGQKQRGGGKHLGSVDNPVLQVDYLLEMLGNVVHVGGYVLHIGDYDGCDLLRGKL